MSGLVGCGARKRSRTRSGRQGLHHRAAPLEGDAVTIGPAARTAVVAKTHITVPPLVQGDVVTIVPAARTAVKSGRQS